MIFIIFIFYPLILSDNNITIYINNFINLYIIIKDKNKISFLIILYSYLIINLNLAYILSSLLLIISNKPLYI